MSGELLPIWSATWPEIWLRLRRSRMTPEDLFMELMRELSTPPKQPKSPSTPSLDAFNADGELIDAIAIQRRNDYEKELISYNDKRQRYEQSLNIESEAIHSFKNLLNEVSSESKAVEILEESYSVLCSYAEHTLASNFKILVRRFINRFNLRYELRDPFSLHPTLPGVFSKLISELKTIANSDPHLNSLLLEFEEAFADLKSSRTQSNIKSCLQKQYNLLEALGRNCPNVTETTLGAICNQLDWPHVTIKEVGKKLYGFGSSYPGVRHAGDASSAVRQLEMRDLVSLTLMLASLTPYVTHGLNSDRCYSA